MKKRNHPLRNKRTTADNLCAIQCSVPDFADPFPRTRPSVVLKDVAFCVILYPQRYRTAQNKVAAPESPTTVQPLYVT